MGTPPGDDRSLPALSRVSPPADHRVERPRVEGGQPSERSGAHGRGRSSLCAPWGWPTSPSAGARAHPIPSPASQRWTIVGGTPRLARRRPLVDGGVPGVSERGGAPPGPIPNPVVPSASAGRVLGGQLPGKRGPCARHPPVQHRSRPHPSSSTAYSLRRGVEQRQLVGLITQRSWVRIPPPLP